MGQAARSRQNGLCIMLILDIGFILGLGYIRWILAVIYNAHDQNVPWAVFHYRSLAPRMAVVMLMLAFLSRLHLLPLLVMWVKVNGAACCMTHRTIYRYRAFIIQLKGVNMS